MLAHIFSDLHLEFLNTGKTQIFEDHFNHALNKSKADLLILAGDIIEISSKIKSKAYDWYMTFCHEYPQVIFVPGNHEHYDSSFEKVDKFFEEISSSCKNFKILKDGEFFNYKGQEFYGGTLWFDNDFARYLKRYLNDFNYIKDFEPEVYKRHDKFVDGFKNITKDIVVITHHLPSTLCIADQYKDDPVNHFFCSDLSKYLKTEDVPKLFLFGHSHCPVDKTVEGTRFYSNPLGYVNERTNPNFWNRIEIKI